MNSRRTIFSSGSMGRASRPCSSATGCRRILSESRGNGLGSQGSPFLYRGSIGPWPIDATLAGRLRLLGDRLVSALGLVGWFGVDYVLHDGNPWPVEINPRYTASIEIHELAAGRSLLALHRRACEGISDRDERLTARASPPSTDDRQADPVCSTATDCPGNRCRRQ